MRFVQVCSHALVIRTDKGVVLNATCVSAIDLTSMALRWHLVDGCSVDREERQEAQVALIAGELQERHRVIQVSYVPRALFRRVGEV